MDDNSLRAFARANIELRETNLSKESRELKRKCDENRAAITKYLVQNCDGDVLRVSNNACLKLKYNRSSRSVTYQHIHDVVNAIGDQDLQSLHDVNGLTQLIATRIHQVRTKKTPAFDVVNPTNRAVRNAPDDMCARFDDLQRTAQELDKERLALKTRKENLKSAISEATVGVSRLMQNRRLNGGGVNDAPSKPIRVDVRGRGTFFVREKAAIAKSRPQTKQMIFDFAKAATHATGLTDSNFKLQFTDRKALVVQAMYDEMVERKADQSSRGDELRYTLDCSTKKSKN